MKITKTPQARLDELNRMYVGHAITDKKEKVQKIEEPIRNDQQTKLKQQQQEGTDDKSEFFTDWQMM